MLIGLVVIGALDVFGNTRLGSRKPRSNMEIYQAFDRTLKDLDIRASQVAAGSGVSESDISRFRNGDRDIRSSKFARLLFALPSHAQDYFWFIFRYSDLGIQCRTVAENGARYGPAPVCELHESAAVSA